MKTFFTFEHTWQCDKQWVTVPKLCINKVIFAEYLLFFWKSQICLWVRHGYICKHIHEHIWQFPSGNSFKSAWRDSFQQQYLTLQTSNSKKYFLSSIASDMVNYIGSHTIPLGSPNLYSVVQISTLFHFSKVVRASTIENCSSRLYPYEEVRLQSQSKHAKISTCPGQ